jgi:hypothetical protein
VVRDRRAVVVQRSVEWVVGERLVHRAYSRPWPCSGGRWVLRRRGRVVWESTGERHGK